MTAARALQAAAAAGLALCAALLWLAPIRSETAATQADVKHGADIAAQGTADGAPACAQCHGSNGAPADDSGTFPRIAGQSTYYLAGQLRAFAGDLRTEDVMTPIAKALKPEEIADSAAYYAGASAPFPQLPAPDAALLARGQQLATIGDGAKRLQACNSCHGPGGTGESMAIPYLAGQYGPYLTRQLQMWQQGARKTSPNAMAVIARQLDDHDIAAVSAYYQQIRAPGAAAAN